MHIGICKITIRLPQNRNLKEKRRAIKSICSRIRNKFNVSITEVGYENSWKLSTLGISCTADQSSYCNNVITKITEYILSSPHGFELVDHEQEIIDGF